jgi:glycosyltransferase involved in cell wall biosynthesis
MMVRTNVRPTISIVTPSYNQGRFLTQTIESVLNQSGQGVSYDLEYFVVDGGSTDESKNVIAKYASQLTWSCSEPDAGQTDAINKGFQHATGDILAYINSDDYYLPGAFEAVVKTFAKHPSIDVIYGQCQYVTESGELLRLHQGRVNSLTDMLDLWNVWRSRDGRKHLVQPEVFWRRSLWDQIGSFDQGRSHTMDFDFWLRAFAADAQFLSIEVPLAAFRKHANQKTALRDKTTRELLEIVQVYLNRVDLRVSKSDRNRLKALAELESAVLDSRNLTDGHRRRRFVQIAAKSPRLLLTKPFWRYLRKAGD